jgi:GT2 family glycosyltransferase
MATNTIVPPPEHSARLPFVDHVSQEHLVSVATPSGLATILVPCCGQLEYTKLCVPSLLKHTRQPFEIIFIDVGSLDGTNEYLQGLTAGATHLHIEIVRTATDLGLAKAVQDAIQLARGEYLVLLNNDVIVTDAWLHQLVNLSKLSPTIGLVGPMSNYAAPPQLVDHIPYRVGPRQDDLDPTSSHALVDTAAVETFARQWRDEHRGQWLESDRLGGFCLLVKRDVLKRIGHLREAGDLALFDTDQLSGKARQAGFKLACCKDLFVHHFGTRTFAHGAPLPDSDATNA